MTTIPPAARVPVPSYELPDWGLSGADPIVPVSAPVAAPAPTPVSDLGLPGRAHPDSPDAYAGLQAHAFNSSDLTPPAPTPVPDSSDGSHSFTVGPHDTEAAQEGYQHAHEMGVGIGPNYQFFDPKMSQFEDQAKNLALEGQQEVGVDPVTGRITKRPPIRWAGEGQGIAESQRATDAQNLIMNAAVGGADNPPMVQVQGADGKVVSIPGTEMEVRKFYAQDPRYAQLFTDSLSPGDIYAKHYPGEGTSGLPLKTEYEAKVQEALQHAQNTQSIRNQILMGRLGIKTP